MSFEKGILPVLDEKLQFQFSRSFRVTGGDINQSFCIISEKDERLFLKFNDDINHHVILESEAWALRLMHSKGISVPSVRLFHSSGNWSILVLDYIDASNRWSEESLDDFVENLVRLHSITNNEFGLHADNCIGSLIQYNSWYTSFSDYYWSSRIEPQLRLAYDNGYFTTIKQFSNLKRVFESFPEEHPRLIHGDLWSGNYLVDQSGKSFLIDPAVNYGSREMDLAMMHLFGGFPKVIFDKYNERIPLENGSDERRELFQLYYLLVHLNLFGRSYLPRVLGILKAHT